MGTLVEIRNFLPEPKNKAKLNPCSVGRKIASAGAAIVLTLSAGAPVPTAHINIDQVEISKNVQLPAQTFIYASPRK